MTWRIEQGDCLELLKTLEPDSVDAVVTDPPYGMNHDTQYKRFRGGKKPSRDYVPIHGDNEPFDPTPWLGFPKVVLFGSNHFAARLPVGTTLVWLKRRDAELGSYLSDCEIAWQKGGKGVYLFRHLWRGFDRDSERGSKTLHPTQKPVALMEWVISRLKLPPGSTILDPYMGSGSTGVAAIKGGFSFVGFEREAAYCDIARKRLEAASAQPRLEVA